jgi:hypothetical protein
MVKKPVCLVQRSVKTARNIEVSYFLIHAAKVGNDFGIRMLDFGFFWMHIKEADHYVYQTIINMFVYCSITSVLPNGQVVF